MNEGKSSALDRLSGRIFPDGDSERQLMAKLSAYAAYFDAGGHPSDQPFVVVSGYVANCHQWQFFNRMWESIHKQFGMAMPFHCSDFYARKGQYSKWAKDDPEAQKFVTTLASAQQIYMLLGVSCIVDMGVYQEIDDVFMLQTMVPAFALGLRCVDMPCGSVLRWGTHSPLLEFRNPPRSFLALCIRFTERSAHRG